MANPVNAPTPVTAGVINRGITNIGGATCVGDIGGPPASILIVGTNQQSVTAGPYDETKVGDTENNSVSNPTNIQNGGGLAPEGYTNQGSKGGLYS